MHPLYTDFHLIILCEQILCMRCEWVHAVSDAKYILYFCVYEAMNGCTCIWLVIMVHWKEACQGKVEAGLWAERGSLQAGLLLAQGVCWGPVELWVRWKQEG